MESFLPTLLLTSLQGLLLISGGVLFVVGSIGLLRFPDTCSRVHALTKADNLGLGLIVLGLILGTNSLGVALKLLLIWLLVMFASTLSGHLVAWYACYHPAEKPLPQEPSDD
ncbi:cation:proton antiporter [Nitrincola tapanii]|uniref:Na+/H+ antiporter subunit G n=1 Tax=Nitrincola tapanii TaxID=1708751 RepID=A0A5A9W6V1_9GAMM|nr:monovalent cation/H(+) antiporter subunit G [Nitrincola tapanii]KAA0876520.1 Na+/H+ antiporter subunit G [Nitrincola tapanii]